MYILFNQNLFLLISRLCKKKSNYRFLITKNVIQQNVIFVERYNLQKYIGIYLHIIDRNMKCVIHDDQITHRVARKRMALLCRIDRASALLTRSRQDCIHVSKYTWGEKSCFVLRAWLRKYFADERMLVTYSKIQEVSQLLECATVLSVDSIK